MNLPDVTNRLKQHNYTTMKTFKEIFDNRNVPFPLEINEEGYGKWYVIYTDSDYEAPDEEQFIATRTKKEALYVKQLIQQGHL